MRFLTVSMAFTLVSTVSSAELGQRGKAEVRGTLRGSPAMGLVRFEETKEGLEVSAELTGLPPGTHGFHIHEFGDCSEGGQAAGEHYNPLKTRHGLLSRDGPSKAHAGDMGNITADEKGVARMRTILRGAALTGGTASVAGRAVVVHEKPDDLSQPSGNAGARIACGVIGLSR